MNAILRYAPLLIILSFVGTGCSGEDHNAKTERTVILSAGKVHEGWYFGAGDEVRIEGTVNGDAYVAGGNVDISGTINGDLLVAGGMVTVDGTVSDNIRAAGGTIRINGNVGKSVTAAGGNVLIAHGAKVQNYLLAAGGKVDIAGEIAKGVRVGAGQMLITGTVGEGLDFGGGQLTVAQGARIGGDVNVQVKNPEDVEIAEGSVRGTVSIHQPIREEESFLSSVAGRAIWMLCLLFTALVAALVLPRQVQRAGTLLLSSPGKTALWGVLGVIAVPIAAIIIMITLVGIPVGLFVLLLYVWFLYLSQLSLGVVLAQWMFRLGERKGWALTGVVLLGVLIVHLIAFVPYVRLVIELVSVVVGMGVLLRLVHEAWCPASAKGGNLSQQA